jgi:hypothetical protein
MPPDLPVLELSDWGHAAKYSSSVAQIFSWQHTDSSRSGLRYTWQLCYWPDNYQTPKDVIASNMKGGKKETWFFFKSHFTNGCTFLTLTEKVDLPEMFNWLCVGANDKHLKTATFLIRQLCLLTPWRPDHVCAQLLNCFNEVPLILMGQKRWMIYTRCP